MSKLDELIAELCPDGVSHVELNEIAEYAKMFGFDSKSGIELPESSPNISDYDSVRSAIGQGTNSYTPSQISRYATALASEGDLYNLSVLDYVTDSEGNKIAEFGPELINKIEKLEGMLEVLRAVFDVSEMPLDKRLIVLEEKHH